MVFCHLNTPIATLCRKFKVSVKLREVILTPIEKEELEGLVVNEVQLI